MIDKKQQRQLSRRRFLKRTALTLGGVGVLYSEARFVEPNWIDLSRHTVYLPELPLALDGMVVAHLTDLHYGPVTPTGTITAAVALAANAEPDLVALTGDFVNRDVEEAAGLSPLLAPLRKAQFGMWGCLGNHDYHDYSGNTVAATMEKAGGVNMLRNAAELAAKGLYVAGIEDTMRGAPNAVQALSSVPDVAACLFLTHNPTGVWGASRRSCLALAGHTHGGQVRVPFLPPQLPKGMEGFPMYEGWGTFDKAQLFISRGVGMMTLPLRFRCRPEVAIITLNRGYGTPRNTSDLMARGARKTKRVVRTVYHWLA